MNRSGSPYLGLALILILFAASVGFMHGRKKIPIRSSATQQSSLTIQDTIDLITPLVISRSFDAISHTLNQSDEPTINGVIQYIMNRKNTQLSSSEKAKLFLNFIANLENKKVHQTVFTLLKNQHANDPIFSYIILEKIMPAIDRVQVLSKKQPKVMKKWAEQSLLDALELNDVDMLDTLYAHNIRVSPDFASVLLDKVVMNSNDVAFIPLLVRRLKADINYSPDGKKTVLIKAVENNDEPIVRALLEEGAEPDKWVDEEVGTPGQIAFEKGFVGIGQLLRDAGHK